jgi:microcin C transport system ATP-binding protein
MTLLTLENLSVQFRGAPTPTVRNLSLGVAKGKTTAIVGESGSGKSITALSILGLNSATTCPEGRIMFDGQDLTRAKESELRRIRGNAISMIFQEPMTALNPLHTIGKQLREILVLHQPTISKSEIASRITTLLEEVGLDYVNNRLNDYPHQLSGGERQRIMIAMAIANQPALLIADEPTTALDVTTQAKIIALLTELQQKYGMSLLIITHDLHLVKHIADRVVVMKEGTAVEQGDAKTLFTTPAHPYTQALLAATHASTPAPYDASAEEILSCHELSVSYAKAQGFSFRRLPPKIAVKPLSLTIRAGETLGIVGESGSGKTTLGLALARLISSEGRIVFQGQSLETLSGRDLRPIRSRLQFVFQDPFSSLNPRMNIGQIIAEGLNLHAPDLIRAEKDSRVSDILEKVGLEASMANRYPHEFSGGQRQRINIARAMILRPACVIFDEPTSALDITLQTQIIGLLKSFQTKQRLSYLFISHDIHAIQSISHHIIVLKDGDVVENGAAADVLTNPQHPYTQSLIHASGLQ